MFGFHPFATQSFSSAVPFLDILATTNALTSAISAAVMESRIITTTAGTVSSTIQSLPANSIILAVPESSTVLSGTLTFALKTPSTFKYNDVSDNVGETWSDVVTTSSSESWSEV